MNLLEGDCLSLLSEVEPLSADLIYLDPPFYSQRDYGAFDDRWMGGIDQYLEWMAERLQACHRVLKPTGSIYLHCDHHAAHRLRTVMDDIFGANNFINEIIWHYRKWSAGDGLYQRNHDNIYFYQKSNAPGRPFNTAYMPRAASTLKRFGEQKIISGHDDEGKRVPSQMAKEKSVGVALDDVWDIGRVPPVKQLYPTQKPLALLERIISVSSNPDDLVIDPFCGSGTTLVAAQSLGRRWIGIDTSSAALAVARSRLVTP